MTIRKITLPNGNVEYRNEFGELHNPEVPAKVTTAGTEYRINGLLHREGDKPAIEEGADGTKRWYKNGQLHRDGDKPAIDWASGDKEWYKNGQLHRDGDKPAIEWASGTKKWYKE